MDRSPAKPGTAVTGADHLPNPFHLGDVSAGNKVVLRTEEEQQAAAREREEKERKEMEKDIKARRDARRKSLANRRVSFAPEATLHTWDVVEYMQDSTTSSAATNSTRRASSASSMAESPGPRTPTAPDSDASEPPSTPPEQVEDDTLPSPAHQRDLHQKKRRRSSGIPPMNFNNPDEFSSSPYSGSSVAESEDGHDEFMGEDVEESDADSNSDDDGTMMSIDDGETTNMSLASIASDATGSSARLEKNLRLAANQAGIPEKEHNENQSQDTQESVIASFQPWGKKQKGIQNLSSQNDQENLNPFSPAFKVGITQEDSDVDDEDADMTMEMTRAVGGIMSSDAPNDEMTMDITQAIGGILPAQPLPNKMRQQSVASGRRQSTRRKSVTEESASGDETMDLTMAIGGIQGQREMHDDTEALESHEEMTMEFTSVIGGVLPSAKLTKADNVDSRTHRRESLTSVAEDEEMDMTVAIGGIVPARQDSVPVEDDDQTMGMDITMAIGGILPNATGAQARNRAKQLMELETDSADMIASPLQPAISNDSAKSTLPQPTAVTASETGSPSLAGFRGKGLRRSGEQVAATPKSPVKCATPIKKPVTPPKQLTPQPSRPTTPGKISPSKNVVMRSSSPKRLFAPEIKSSRSTPTSTTPRKVATPNKLFQKDLRTGLATPSVVLTPQRSISGVGADKVGLGSPRVAALLDRRGSIGEKAAAFTAGQAGLNRGVRFDDPSSLENEVDKDRAEDESRENGRKILEREADQEQEDKDVTSNLKDLIGSLTPKKKPLKGRKSLHVGAAKGILGKRPAELDEDNDDDDEGGVKRLKGHQESPVKNVKLQAPPSKAETTGRNLRGALQGLDSNAAIISTPTTSTSPNKNAHTTPKGQGRFKDVEQYASAKKAVPLVEKPAVEDVMIEEDDSTEERVHLQDFLNMTSIRFMELTTTKRRHTVAPNALHDSESLLPKHAQDTDDGTLESCVVAGACTVPMLELYQHVSFDIYPPML
jgi:kinetochore protein Spc7/SPC105